MARGRPLRSVGAMINSITRKRLGVLLAGAAVVNALVFSPLTFRKLANLSPDAGSQLHQFIVRFPKFLAKEIKHT